MIGWSHFRSINLFPFTVRNRHACQKNRWNSETFPSYKLKKSATDWDITHKYQNLFESNKSIFIFLLLLSQRFELLQLKQTKNEFEHPYPLQKISICVTNIQNIILLKQKYTFMQVDITHQWFHFSALFDNQYNAICIYTLANFSARRSKIVHDCWYYAQVRWILYWIW